jgi:hypothetical protein
VLPDDGVLHRNMWELFNVNFNENLILFLRLSYCASVGEKTLIIIKMHGLYVKEKTTRKAVSQEAFVFFTCCY